MPTTIARRSGRFIQFHDHVSPPRIRSTTIGRSSVNQRGASPWRRSTLTISVNAGDRSACCRARAIMLPCSNASSTTTLRSMTTFDAVLASDARPRALLPRTRRCRESTSFQARLGCRWCPAKPTLHHLIDEPLFAREMGHAIRWASVQLGIHSAALRVNSAKVGSIAHLHVESVDHGLNGCRHGRDLCSASTPPSPGRPHRHRIPPRRDRTAWAAVWRGA